MARRFTLELIMDLASQIGANPAKAVSRSNISFLGKGPTKNPLFQNRLAGLENATKANLGKPETLFGAIEDAVGWAKDGKLNSIQTEILGHNLSGINKILNPPPLPMATVMRLPKQETGIASVLPKQGKVEEVFFGNPKDPRFYKSPTVDDRGRTWDFKSRLQEPGPGDIEALNRALNQKTGMSRAIARQILQQDTRIKLKPEELFMLKEGKGEPLDLMRKYYGNSMLNLDAWLDDFLPRTTLPPRDLASRVLNEVELIPQFAEGGLADVLQVRSGYSKGRLVKGALAILNRNKKNADYMYKASDNVSPGYAKGDLKYNAELLADQLAEDAGVAYAELGALEQTKFYGTAYDFLAQEKRMMNKLLAEVDESMARQALYQWSPGKGRKPNASGGLAEILQAPRKRYAKGSGRGRQDPMGGFAHQTAQEMREAAPDQFGGGMNISHGGGGGGGGPTITTDGGQNFNVEGIQTFKDQENKYLDKFGAGINRNRAYAAGLLSLEDLMEGSIKPDIYAGYTGDNFNISGQKTKDMTGVDASTMIGPVNVTGSYQDFDGDVNKNISAASNLGGVDFGVNYDFEGKPTFGASYDTDNFSGGLTYDGEPEAMFNFSKVLEPRPKSVVTGKYYSKGGLAGILEV